MTGTGADHRRYAFGEFTLDVGLGVLRRAGEELHLRPRSFEVLCHLVEHAGAVIERQALMDAVWGRTVVTDDSLTQCIVEVRRALDDRQQQVVRTVPRRGFVFQAAVRLLPEDAAPSPAPSSVATASPLEVASPGPPRRFPRSAAALVSIAAVVALAWWLLATRGGSPVPPEPSPPPPARSVAVLRFLDLSAQGDQGYFADGLAEEIRHLLASSRDLRVVARSSSFAFAATDTAPTEIARQLGVAHVLAGSVRRDAGQLRVTVELVDGATGMVAWSRSYDAPFARLLAVQGEIAADVAAALSVALVHSDRPASLQQAQAHDLFLHGRYLFNRRAPGDLPTAERRLEQAVRLDPGHARAWTALAGAYFVRAIEELDDPAYRLHEQGVALENALRLDPLLAEAHLRQSCYFELAGAPDLARAAAERARRLSPRDPLVLGAAAARAVMDGRLDDAIADQRAMVEIDPLSAVNRNNYGRTLLGAGRFVEGLAELRRAAELSSHPDTLLDIARVLLLLDRGDEVRGLLDRLPAGPPRDQILVLLDPHPEGDRASDRLQADATLRGRRLRAEIAAFRGDADAAFEQLHAALPGIGAGGRFSRARDECIEITLSPYLRRLHADPRWSQLMADLRAL